MGCLTYPRISSGKLWKIVSQTTLVTRHPWLELKEMIHEQVQKTYPMIHVAQEIVPTPAPPIQVSYPRRSVSTQIKRGMRSCRYSMPISPSQMQIDRACRGLLRHLHLERLKQVEDQRMVVSLGGHEQRFAKLIRLVHSVCDRPCTSIPWLPVHQAGKRTMKFGNYMGGSLQMLRDGVWHSYDKDNVWLSFDALKVTHRVSEVLCGNCYPNTLYTPDKLGRLTPRDWDTLSRLGFPVCLCEIASIQMRRQDGEEQVSDWVATISSTDASGSCENTNANAATSSDTQSAGADPGRTYFCQALRIKF